MSAQVGDVITTAEGLDALPEESILRTPSGNAVLYDEGALFLTGSDKRYRRSDHEVFPLTVLYLPGQPPPHPERVVKAEALREAASSLDKYGVADVTLRTSVVERSLRDRADRHRTGRTVTHKVGDEVSVKGVVTLSAPFGTYVHFPYATDPTGLMDGVTILVDPSYVRRVDIPADYVAEEGFYQNEEDAA